jgi:hypothetical protein
MNQLHCIVYVSAATRPLAAADLNDILRSARDSNDAAGVTGLLLHSGGNFMQLLEGSLDALEEVLARIEGSSRHHQITELMREPSEAREFAEWSMASSQATAPQFLALREASWRVRVDAGGEPAEPAGRGLLRQFWQSTR